MPNLRPRILILGIGNTLRQDDGVGYRLAEQAAALKLPDVESRSVHQLTPELAAEIAGASLVLFIDARISPGQGQAVGPEADPTRVLLEPVNPSPEFWTCPHTATPANLMALAIWLYKANPKALALTIRAANLDLGEGLSPEVECALPAVLQVIHALIQNHANFRD